jgi:hypothetical protein
MQQIQDFYNGNQFISFFVLNYFCKYCVNINERRKTWHPFSLITASTEQRVKDAYMLYRGKPFPLKVYIVCWEFPPETFYGTGLWLAVALWMCTIPAVYFFYLSTTIPP